MADPADIKIFDPGNSRPADYTAAAFIILGFFDKRLGSTWNAGDCLKNDIII